MKNGNNLILVSKTGGVWQVIYNQHDLSAFIYKNKKLVPYPKKIFPSTDERIFMKEGIPDSLSKAILNYPSMIYDFSGERVMLSLNRNYISVINSLESG